MTRFCFYACCCAQSRRCRNILSRREKTRQQLGFEHLHRYKTENSRQIMHGNLMLAGLAAWVRLWRTHSWRLANRLVQTVHVWINVVSRGSPNAFDFLLWSAPPDPLLRCSCAASDDPMLRSPLLRERAANGSCSPPPPCAASDRSPNKSSNEGNCEISLSRDA